MTLWAYKSYKFCNFLLASPEDGWMDGWMGRLEWNTNQGLLDQLARLNPLSYRGSSPEEKALPYRIYRYRKIFEKEGRNKTGRAASPENVPIHLMALHELLGRVAQSVGHLTRKSGALGSIPGLATYFRYSFRFFKKSSCQLLAKVCARSTD